VHCIEAISNVVTSQPGWMQGCRCDGEDGGDLENVIKCWWLHL